MGWVLSFNVEELGGELIEELKAQGREIQEVGRGNKLWTELQFQQIFNHLKNEENE